VTGKTVGLFQAPIHITYNSFKTDPITGDVVELLCKLENESTYSMGSRTRAIGQSIKADELRVFGVERLET
jgi:glutaminyl-tRNA synthetase